MPEEQPQPRGWDRLSHEDRVVIIALSIVVFCAIVISLIVAAPERKPGRVPNVVEQGQAYGIAQLRSAGYNDIESHDAWGRDRDGRDTEWQICSQSPAGGSKPGNVDISLGVVPVEEPCPAREIGDQGVPRPMRIHSPMPDLTRPVGRTAHMVREDFGDEASLQFIDKDRPGPEHPFVKDDLGDWYVCAQSIPPGEIWRGRPVTLTVTKFHTRC